MCWGGIPPTEMRCGMENIDRNSFNNHNELLAKHPSQNENWERSRSEDATVEDEEAVVVATTVPPTATATATELPGTFSGGDEEAPLHCTETKRWPRCTKLVKKHPSLHLLCRP